MPSILVSYARQDVNLMRLFEKHLTRSSSENVLVWHSENLTIGDNWRLEIERRLKSADAFVLLVTENYLSSTNTVYEMGRIVQINKSKSIPAIPIVKEPIRINDTPVADILGFVIPFESDPNFEREIERAAIGTIRTLRVSLYNRLPIDAGEVYLSFRMLEPGILSGIMDSIKFLHYLIYGVLDKRFLNEPVRAIREVEDIDRLRILTIETGDSIKFSVKSGWKPNLELSEGDLIVELPKGALSVVATFYLLITAIQYGVSTYSDALDIIKKQNEIHMQQYEEEKLKLEIKKLREEIDKAPKSTRDDIDHQISKFQRFTIHNRDIGSLKLKTRHLQVEVYPENKKWVLRDDER